MRIIKTIVGFWMLLLLGTQGTTAWAQHFVGIDGVVDSTLVLPKLGNDSVYLVNESLRVVDSGVLHVNAGVKIYFAESASLRVDGGSLILDGQADDSIYLLCYEFSHDWAGMQVKNVGERNNVSMSYVEVVGALTALSATNSINVGITHCSFNNYYAGRGLELVDCSGFVIDSCHFFRCNSGIALKAKTVDSEDNHITHCIFDQGQINIELSNVGYGFKCNNTVIADNCFQGAATAISCESVGGMMDKDAKNYILNNLISSDLPEGGSNYSSFGIKAAMDSLVIRNNVFWSNDEAISMLRVCHLVIEQNSFYDNGLTITNLLASGTAVFEGNTFSETQKRVAGFPSHKSRMNGNNFLHYDKEAVLFANISSDNIDMIGNYWDADTLTDIEAVIFDQHDNPSLGAIVYEPRLAECDTTVPVSPPFMVKKQWVDGVWRISWDANPEADLDHYVLFYGDFVHYKFAHHIDSIFGLSYTLSSQQADNVAVMACDGAYNPDVYSSRCQSPYAFATNYPYAGEDGTLCASEVGYELHSTSIPFTYSRFVWHTSGSGMFSDSLSLSPTYYPSVEDFDAGEVTLSLNVLVGGVVKTDAIHLRLLKQIEVFAGEDYYSGMDRPLHLDHASTSNCDSVRWTTLGDGRFEDGSDLHTVYYPGSNDKAQRKVRLVLQAWSLCDYASDSVNFDLFEEFSLEGKVWVDGSQASEIQVIAASLNDNNSYTSGYYRTVSDENGRFKFEALLPDRYILYAFPDTVEMTAGGAYYLGDFQWNESNMIDVDGHVFDVDLALPALAEGFPVGEGRISGFFDYPETPFKARDFYCCSWLRDSEDTQFCSSGLSNVGVLLFNANKQRLLGFALTDAEGRFHFDGLPFGTYCVMADVPRYGRGATKLIALSQSQPEVADMHLFINADGKVAMRPWNANESGRTWQVYPNPVESQVTLKGMEVGENYWITVTNVLGNVVVPSFRLQADLLGEGAFSVEHLSSGVYYVIAESPSERQIIKLVKY